MGYRNVYMAVDVNYVDVLEVYLALCNFWIAFTVYQESGMLFQDAVEPEESRMFFSGLLAISRFYLQLSHLVVLFVLSEYLLLLHNF